MNRRGCARTRAGILAFAVALSTVALGGCTAASSFEGPRFVVDQTRTTVADPVGLAVSGLVPGRTVAITATAVSGGQTWTSRAVYDVPVGGYLDLATQRPGLAPFPVADANGLLWSLAGPDLSQAQLERTWVQLGMDIRLTATEPGEPTATTLLHRQPLSIDVGVRPVLAGDLPASAGGAAAGSPDSYLRVGTYYFSVRSQDAQGRHPAVILIDGDDGGASAAFVASQLARSGFDTFALPAFGPPDQLPGSSGLAVETFDQALAWLSGLRDVDPARIFTFGTWRAEPIALWLAANRSRTVYGALVASGTTALLCPSTGGPVLTADGADLPCDSGVRGAAGTTPIDLAAIPGPVVLGCGTADDVLAGSCAWQAAGAATRGRREGDTVLRAVGAGHTIAAPPVIAIGLDGQAPSIAQATEQGRVSFWMTVLATLQAARRD